MKHYTDKCRICGQLATTCGNCKGRSRTVCETLYGVSNKFLPSPPKIPHAMMVRTYNFGRSVSVIFGSPVELPSKVVASLIEIADGMVEFPHVSAKLFSAR